MLSLLQYYQVKRQGVHYHSAVFVLQTFTYMAPKNLKICSSIQVLQAQSSKFQIFENSLPTI